MKTILIGGPAGEGVNTSAKIISNVLHKYGYYVFNQRMYGSLITGGHNYNVITFDSKPIFSNEKKYDVIIALDDKTLEIHKKELKKDGLIISSKVLGIKEDANLKVIFYLMKLFGIPDKYVEEEIYNLFGKKLRLDVEVEPIFKIKRLKKKGVLIDGSQGVVEGALASGIDLYIAYPMTPATPLMNYFSKRIRVIQLENEIAVANASLGASYAGAKVMLGTSGGGFALMGEAMSLQGMSETPLVAYLAQRADPSTGVPTYTEQGDLKFAINIGHGEFPKVVVAPGDPAEAFRLTQEAFYLSSKYQVLSIILSDKHLAESQYTIKLPKKIKVPSFIVDTKKGYKRYKITKSGISPRGIPGGEGIVKATSYEHDEFGITTEDADKIKAMVDKRLRKWDSLREGVKKFETYKVYGSGKNLIVSWGSTKGAIIDALNHLKGWKFLQILYLEPFPKEVLRILKNAKRVVDVENNSTGLLSQVIMENTGFKIKNKILRYDGRPFSFRDILEGLK